MFEERGLKQKYLEKNISEQSREPTTSTHIWHRVWESNPGHIGGLRVLSPQRYPCSMHSHAIVITIANCPIKSKRELLIHKNAISATTMTTVLALKTIAFHQRVSIPGFGLAYWLNFFWFSAWLLWKVWFLGSPDFPSYLKPMSYLISSALSWFKLSLCRRTLRPG